MKRTVVLWLMPLLLACDSSTPENEALVTGEITGLDAGELISIAPANDMSKAQSMAIENGRFTFHVPVKAGEGDWYQMWIGSVPSPSKMTNVYLEPGETHIKTSTGGFTDANFSGSTNAQEYNEISHLLAKADSASEAALFLQQFIKAHPASGLGTALLDRYKMSPLAADTAVVYFKQRAAAALNNRPAKRLQEWIQKTADVMPGKMAPEFAQPDTAGKAVALKSFHGKYVLVDFWASWCRPCRAENPNLLKAYEQYQQKGFTVLGVSLDMNDKAAWIKAIHQDKLPWTQLSDLKAFENAAAVLYHVEAIPSNFLIDPDGKIVARDLRGRVLWEKLNEIFK